MSEPIVNFTWTDLVWHCYECDTELEDGHDGINCPHCGSMFMLGISYNRADGTVKSTASTASTAKEEKK